MAKSVRKNHPTFLFLPPTGVNKNCKRKPQRRNKIGRRRRKNCSSEIAPAAACCTIQGDCVKLCVCRPPPVLATHTNGPGGRRRGILHCLLQHPTGGEAPQPNRNPSVPSPRAHTPRPHGFPTLVCLSSSQGGEDVQLNSDDANLRQPGGEEKMSNFGSMSISCKSTTTPILVSHQRRQCCCSGKRSIGNPCGHPVPTPVHTVQ